MAAFSIWEKLANGNWTCRHAAMADESAAIQLAIRIAPVSTQTEGSASQLGRYGLAVLPSDTLPSDLASAPVDAAGPYRLWHLVGPDPRLSTNWGLVSSGHLSIGVALSTLPASWRGKAVCTAGTLSPSGAAFHLHLP